ncbi:hypothetical protein K523DRAFT_354192 [Schizophyllum commune Tattone D]|nr:hypothetical protein K523DRAFT_354192 [Schizophyllum commune Tattone D]
MHRKAGATACAANSHRSWFTAYVEPQEYSGFGAGTQWPSSHWNAPVREGDVWTQQPHITRIASECYWVEFCLAGASPEHRLCPRGQEEMHRLSEYSSLTGNAILAYSDILENVRQAILCEPGAFDSASAYLIIHYAALQRNFDHVIVSGGRLLDSLADFRKYIMDKFSHPYSFHFLVAKLWGSTNTPRDTALSVVPRKIQEITTEVKSVVALAARLKAALESLRQHFSMPKLREARQLDGHTQMELVTLVNQAAFSIYSYASDVRKTASRIERYASRSLQA